MINIIKGTDAIGLKVVSLNNGAEIAKVHDIIYDPVQNKVKAILVDEGGWFSSSKVILIEDVKSIGKDAVIVEDENSIKKANEVSERVESIAQDKNYLTKSKVLTDGGAVLGKVTDLYFDVSDGKVTELEVSEGGMKALQSGKKRINIDDIITVGEDAIIVKSSTEIKLDEQSKDQGITGVINTAQEKTKEAFETVKEVSINAADKAKEVGQNVATKVKETTPIVISKAGDLGNQIKDEASNITDSVKQKTAETMERPAVQEAKDNISQTLLKAKYSIQSGQAQEAVKEKAIEIKETTVTAGQSVAGYVQSKASQAGSKISEYRKDNVIGKYLKTNIIVDDMIIGNINDLVTSDMLEQAERYGILNKILNNASDLPVDMHY